MPDESIDNDEKFFSEELAATRHRELKGALKGIASLLNKPTDKSVSDAIEKLIVKLEGIKPPEVHVPPPITPDVIVNVGQEKVVTSVEKLATDLLVELRKFNERPLVAEFKIENGNYGNKIVKVIYNTIKK